MSPLKTIKAHADFQRSKGYPLTAVEEAIAEIERELELGEHYERLLYKALLMFSKAECHPLYFSIIRNESVEYVEEHEFLEGDLYEFKKKYDIWKRP